MHCSILLDYNFNKLEDIWFTSASHLTLATIELLMDRLPELLSIGECWCIALDSFAKINLYNSTKDDNLKSAFQIFTFHLFFHSFYSAFSIVCALHRAIVGLGSDGRRYLLVERHPEEQQFVSDALASKLLSLVSSRNERTNSRRKVKSSCRRLLLNIHQAEMKPLSLTSTRKKQEKGRSSSQNSIMKIENCKFEFRELLCVWEGDEN